MILQGNIIEWRDQSPRYDNFLLMICWWSTITGFHTSNLTKCVSLCSDFIKYYISHYAKRITSSIFKTLPTRSLCYFFFQDHLSVRSLLHNPCYVPSFLASLLKSLPYSLPCTFLLSDYRGKPPPNSLLKSIISKILSRKESLYNEYSLLFQFCLIDSNNENYLPL